MPAAHAQMQTNDGKWHVEETWPPEDVEWREYDVGTWESSGSFTVSATSSELTLTSAFPMEEDIHIQGMPTFHVKVVTGLCNGGQLFVTLRDSTANLRLGHATMDVRYRDGGHDSKITTPLSEYTMLMEFNPMDVRVPAGNNLQLVITETGEDYLPSPCAAIGMNVVGSTSIFSLPLTERGENAKEWFDVPPWWESQDSPE